MINPKGTKPGGPRSSKDQAASSRGDQHPSTGRVVHDERGNAVWNWVKETSRIAIESTSRLLRKLEVPDLKVEDEGDEAPRGSDRDAGGGYDPYNTTKRPRGKR